MQITRKNNSSTEVTLTVIPNEAELSKLKEHVLKRLAKNVRVTGFRAGHAPLPIVEKNIDSAALQQEFLEEGLNHYYIDAIKAEGARPLTKPEIELKKFVPFTTMEFTVTFGVLGELKVADYKKFKVKKVEVKVTDKDVDAVLENLKTRLAEYKEVERKAKNTDRVSIDFKGVDAKGEPVKGADGKDYPLVLGSNTFIPGFEPEVVGLAKGEEKTFTVPFPKDYGVKALQGKKVTFTIKANKIEEVIKPKLDDDFAKQVGPFKSFDDLKNDIKKQIELDKKLQAEREQENELLEQLAEKSKVEIPKGLIEEQIENAKQEEIRNLTYRGQTFEEHLKDEGMTEDEHTEKKLRPAAVKNLTIALLLTEVSQKEGLSVSEKELEERIKALKAQYHNDPQMIKALDDAQYQRDVSARMLSEKTLEKMLSYAK